MDNALLDVEFPSLLPSAMSFWGAPESPTGSSTNSHANSGDSAMMALFNPDTIQAADFLDMPGSPAAELQQPSSQLLSTSNAPHPVASASFPTVSALVRPPRKTAAITYSDQDNDQDDETSSSSQILGRRRPKRVCSCLKRL